MRHEIRRTFYKKSGEQIREIPIMLYEPMFPGKKKHVGIVIQHSDDSYFEFTPALELAERGYTVAVSYFPDHTVSLDRKLVHLREVVSFLKEYPGVDQVILLGHSGGVTLMSAYQAVAENGCRIFQDEHKIIPMDDLGEFPKADGVMFLDANLGNGVMTLLSLDPSVKEETKGTECDPALDLFSEENGFGREECHYSEAFIENYRKAQGKRMNRLITLAGERLNRIEAGEGEYLDDEPMVIAGASQIKPFNKLFPLYPERFFAHTKNEYLLLNGDGTREVTKIFCRSPRFVGLNKTAYFHECTLNTTVKSFLKSSAIRVNENFGYDESGIYGVDWDSSYCTGPGNAAHISAPMLLMGMTGSYEYIAAEQIYERAAAAKDKTIAFVKGAGHNFTPETNAEKYPGEFGDTVGVCFDFVDEWLSERYV